jgi:hypothetical protein
LIINESTALRDNNHRQQLLISAARQTPGKRILFGLDVDEALSANFQASSEWEQICNAKPGTILRFHWANVLPGFQKVWIPLGRRAFGFVDDGSEHRGARTHSPRVPQPPGAPVLDLEEIVVLHFQYLAWERMLSKHRWYQAWEWSVYRQRSAIEIFREYHHMYALGRVRFIHSGGMAQGYDHWNDFRSLKASR